MALPSPIPGPLRAAGAVAALTVALMLPAYWNGYPIFYFDSLDYITLPFTWKIPIYRTAGYGVFAAVELLFTSVWPLIVAQSLIVAYVLVEARRILFPQVTTKAAVAVFVALMIFTGMPWIASTAMPDVFTTPAVLLTLMLAQTETPLGPVRRWLFVLLLAIAGAAHPTHIALCIGLVICIFAVDRLAAYGWPLVRMKVRYVVAGIVLGSVFTVGANWIATGKVFFTPRTTQILTVAVLVEKGMVQEFLAETCDKPAAHVSILCPYRAQLPNDANEFLWHNDFFHKMGGWEAMMKEAPWLLDEIIDRYPLEFLWTMVELTAEQIVTFQTGEGFRTMVGFLDLEMKIYFPHENAAFMAAHQQSYKELPDSPMPTINDLHVPILLTTLPLLVLTVWLAWRRRERLSLAVASLVLLAYLGNAFICGAISNPADRYGSRIVWLVALTVFALLPRLLRRTRTDARETSSAAG